MSKVILTFKLIDELIKELDKRMPAVPSGLRQKKDSQAMAEYRFQKARCLEYVRMILEELHG